MSYQECNSSYKNAMLILRHKEVIYIGRLQQNRKCGKGIEVSRNHRIHYGQEPNNEMVIQDQIQPLLQFGIKYQNKTLEKEDKQIKQKHDQLNKRYYKNQNYHYFIKKFKNGRIEIGQFVSSKLNGFVIMKSIVIGFFWGNWNGTLLGYENIIVPNELRYIGEIEDQSTHGWALHEQGNVLKDVECNKDETRYEQKDGKQSGHGGFNRTIRITQERELKHGQCDEFRIQNDQNCKLDGLSQTGTFFEQTEESKNKLINNLNEEEELQKLNQSPIDQNNFPDRFQYQIPNENSSLRLHKSSESDSQLSYQDSQKIISQFSSLFDKKANMNQ